MPEPIKVAPSVKAAVFLAAGAIGVCLFFLHIAQMRSIQGAKNFRFWSISHIFAITLNSFFFACLVNDWIKHTESSCIWFGVLSDVSYFLARIALWVFFIQRSLFVLAIAISESIWYKILKYCKLVMILYVALGIGNLFLTKYQPPIANYPICNRKPLHPATPIIAWILDASITFLISLCFVAPLYLKVKESVQDGNVWGCKLMKSAMSKMMWVGGVCIFTCFLRFFVDICELKGIRSFFLAFDNILTPLCVVMTFVSLKRDVEESDFEDTKWTMEQ